MKQEVKQVWKDIKELDSQIRTIRTEKYEDDSIDFYLVDIGLYESMGEQGEILTLDYDEMPTEEEIKKDVKEELIKTYEKLKEHMLTGREEQYLKILKKVLK